MIDQFYTPDDVALELLNSLPDSRPSICVDPTCGSGNLLRAARKVFNDVECYGLDKDKNTIKKLKRENPSWNLSVADFLNRRSYSIASAFRKEKNYDLLLLNPPFSQNGKKMLEGNFWGEGVKSSIAMHFVLKSLWEFKPAINALIIAPESLLFSELDEQARCLIRDNYSIEHIVDLDASTFTGTRARTIALKLTPGGGNVNHGIINKGSVKGGLIRLVRGGIQMHTIKGISIGNNVIHSTDLSSMYKGKDSFSGKSNKKISSDMMGHCILLPRVGIPKVSELNISTLNKDIHLSDCVIAIKGDLNILVPLLNVIQMESDDFVNAYRGTGARYITISRLELWLTQRGFNVTLK